MAHNLSLKKVKMLFMVDRTLRIEFNRAADVDKLDVTKWIEGKMLEYLDSRKKIKK